MMSPVLRDVYWALALKAVLLGALYLLLIKPIEPTRADARSTAAAVAGAGEAARPRTSGQDFR